MKDFMKKLLVNILLGAAAGAASAYAGDATRVALENRRSARLNARSTDKHIN